MPTVMVRRRVSANGRFVGTTDTLLKLEPGTQFEGLRADGAALLSRGPVEAEVYALERSGPGRLDFRSRRLEGSTAGLQAFLSRDGASVWLKRGGSGPGSPRRDAFLPFEGGPERPFILPPGDEIAFDWSRPVSASLLHAVRDSTGRARLVEIQVATGRSREVADLPARTPWIFSIPGGGYGIVDLETNSAQGRWPTRQARYHLDRARHRGPPADRTRGRVQRRKCLHRVFPACRVDTVWVRRVASRRWRRLAGHPGRYLTARLARPSSPMGASNQSGAIRPGASGWYRIPPGVTGASGSATPRSRVRGRPGPPPTTDDGSSS